MEHSSFNKYYVLCFGGGGCPSQMGPFKTKEDAERVAEHERARTHTGRFLRPMMGPLSKMSDEQRTKTLRVHSRVEVRQGKDFY
jgi:hypothetical protein